MGSRQMWFLFSEHVTEMYSYLTLTVYWQVIWQNSLSFLWAKPITYKENPHTYLSFLNASTNSNKSLPFFPSLFVCFQLDFVCSNFWQCKECENEDLEMIESFRNPPTLHTIQSEDNVYCNNLLISFCCLHFKQ